MAAIDIETAPACSAAELWPWAARALRRWLRSRGLAERDAVWLVPYAALLPLARQALAAGAGWQVRVETPQTLAESLGPPPVRAPGAVSGDPVRDRLQAAALLRGLAWGRDLERADAARFRHLATLLAVAASTLATRAATLPPAARAAWWLQARAAVPPAGGPAALESSLLRAAIEWAALQGPGALDALHEMRPSAWIVLRLGGADPVAEALAASGPAPALVLQADPDAGSPFRGLLAGASAAGRAVLVGRHAAVDFEAEAAAAAEAVCRGLDEVGAPVALLATDRLLVRRVRALLDSAGVSMSDETGWRVSTTAAAARLMALLQAARADALPDDALQWLKTTPHGRDGWVSTLERRWRGGDRAASAAGLEAERTWTEVQWPLRALRDAGRRPLAEWLGIVDHCWRRDNTQADVQAVVRALRLRDDDPGWLELAGQSRMDLAAFSGWVDEALDATNLEPPRDASAEVVLTPLARALGRPFTRIVVPAADARSLGVPDLEPSLITPPLAQALGLEQVDAQWQRRRLGVAQLLRAGGLTVLRRRHQGIEPMASSPLVLALAADAAALGRPWPEADWRPPTRRVAQQAWQPVEPRAPQLLPERLSASAVGALRDCPYRFHVRSVLRLSESEELDAEADKRDYGNWLHATLHAFHREAAGGIADSDAERERLLALARRCAVELGLDEADLLPYTASLERLARPYLRWQAAREAAGWRWHDGECELQADPAALAPHGLRGRLDRVDLHDDGTVEVIDYKTGSVSDLAAKVREPLEDVQLVFYAALVRGAQPQRTRVGASYLALDDPSAPTPLTQDDVAGHVEPMLQGLAADLAELRGGAPMRALGEGRVCDFCEARGLCRRDHRPVGAAA